MAIKEVVEPQARYAYDQNYPYLQGVLANTGRLPWDIWVAVRAFNEVYFPLGLRPGQTILDVGSCIGNLGNALKIGRIKTVGIDINFHALKEGKSLTSKRNLSIQGDAAILPFRGGTFDAIVSQDLFEHLYNESEAGRALMEMERVLKGERMLHKITVLEDKDWIDGDESHSLKWSTNQWEKWFRDRGWQTVASTTKRFPYWGKKRIGFDKMHGYFLLQHSSVNHLSGR